MADDKSGNAIGFRHPQKLYTRFPYLAHAAWCTLQIRPKDGLNGINNDEHRLDFLDMLYNGIKVCFADDIKLLCQSAEAIGPHPYLPRAFFPGNIENRPLFLCHRGRHSKGQAGFSHSRIPDNENHGAGNDPSSQHTIQFLRTRGKAWQILRLHLSDGLRRQSRGEAEPQSFRFPRWRCRLLYECVPPPAARAASQPLCRIIAAGLADIYCLSLRHHPSPFSPLNLNRK